MAPPRQVSLEAIEAELAALRLGGGPEGGALFRTCTINLVVMTTTPRKAEHFAEVAAAVSEHHPSRTIVISHRPRAKASSLSSRVTAHCRTSEDGRRHVCCERIQLDAVGHVTEHLHSALASLLAGDLPVFLWWTGAVPPRGELLGRILPTADVLIASSGEDGDPGRALAWMAERSRRADRAPALADISWFRLGDWRRFVARSFDEPIPGLDSPDMLSRITLRHAPGHPPAQALLLGAWLAARLGWKALGTVRSRGGVTCRMQASGGEAVLRFLPVSSGIPRGEQIGEVTFSGPSGSRKRLSVAKRRNRFCFLTDRGKSGGFPETRLSPEELLCRVLGADLPDDDYAAALIMAEAMIRPA